MIQSISQPAWNDTQLAEKLIVMSGSEDLSQTLSYQWGRITSGVLQRLKEEVARLIREDIHSAVRLAKITRAVAELCDDPVGLALAHHAYAMAMHFSGHYIEAVSSYNQAETLYTSLGKEVEAARVARAKIDVLMYLGEYQTALAVAAAARDIFQQHGQMILLAQLETNVGNIYHRLDQYWEALKYYQCAGDIFAAHQDEMGLALTKFNSANQYTALNEFERALTLYLEAEHVYEKLDMPCMVNEVKYSIAWLYFQRGKFQESLRLFAKVREQTQALGDTALEALCDLDLAEVYLQLNMYEDALASAQSAIEKFQHLKMNYEYAKAHMYLGIAHTHLNNFPAAGQELQEARRGFLAEGNEVFAALSDVYLSHVFTRQKDWDQALRLCTEARKLFGEQNLSAKAAYTELQLARLKQTLGDPDAAESLCRSAIELVGEVEAPWLKFQCWHLLGNTEQHAGREQEAYQHYIQAIEHLEAMRSSIRGDEFKCTFMKDKLRVYEDLVGLCLRSDAEEKRDEAFSYAEAAKSRSLVELLATDRTITSKNQDPSSERLHQTWNQLREELDYYSNRVSQLEGQNQQHSTWSELQTAVREREQRLGRLARRLSLEDAEYASLHTSPHLAPHQIRQYLAEDEILVEYYVVDGRVQVFALGPDAVRVFTDITTVDAIVPLLRRLRFSFDQLSARERHAPAQLESVEALTRQYLQKLYAALVQPFEPFLDSMKIIVVPHGYLHYVPFHALHDGRQYLIDRNEISYCPSANVFKLCSEKAQTRRTEGQVLIMGIPDEAAPLIREEVKVVNSLWPQAQVFLGGEATLSQLKQTAPTCRLLHLATHGVFRRDNPMFSALKLSDSWLNLYDIFNLRLNADLVTLSACETGVNEVFPGDELFGLMRGFLYAGAPSLIMSLWRVNDQSTTEFMKIFYSELDRGLSKRAALRRAQLGVKQQQYRHPYYWAPFLLIGAPS